MGCSTTKRVILTFFSNNFVKAEVTQSLAGRPPQRKEIAIGLILLLSLQLPPQFSLKTMFWGLFQQLRYFLVPDIKFIGETVPDSNIVVTKQNLLEFDTTCLTGAVSTWFCSCAFYAPFTSRIRAAVLTLVSGMTTPDHPRLCMIHYLMPIWAWDWCVLTMTVPAEVY